MILMKSRNYAGFNTSCVAINQGSSLGGRKQWFCFNTSCVAINQKIILFKDIINKCFNTSCVAINPREYNTYINYNNSNIYIYQYI